MASISLWSSTWKIYCFNTACFHTSLTFSSALLLLKCRYEFFFALLRDFPDLKFTINGGINSVVEVSFLKLIFMCIPKLQLAFKRPDLHFLHWTIGGCRIKVWSSWRYAWACCILQVCESLLLYILIPVKHHMRVMFFYYLLTDLWNLCWLCSPWHTLGHVDTVIYGSPSSGITRRQVLKKINFLK